MPGSHLVTRQRNGHDGSATHFQLTFSSVNPGGVSALLTLTVFINAALLFSVEPMFSKLVLPFLGGAPSVWNTCLVFFQAALVVGYLYAHALSRIKSMKRRAMCHMLVLILSCATLPLALHRNGDPPPGGAGILWLLALLAASLGAPFVMLASGAPIIQRWLADTEHPDAANPYFLYAASNLGSIAALVSYPILVEPWLSLSVQRSAWSAAYILLVVLVALSAIAISRVGGSTTSRAPESATPAPTALDRARWTLYSAVPASLLVGVTTVISTDIAAVPLIWVLPLATYLLTFVIVFARRPLIATSWMSRAEPYALVILVIPLFWSLRMPGLVGIVAHVVVLFIVSMVCHGKLAARRPPPSRLTEFFVWVAVGGLVGGTFNALVAPVVFSGPYEFPIVLALAAVLGGSERRDYGLARADVLFAITLGACLVFTSLFVGTLPGMPAVILTMAFAVVLFSFRDRPWRFGLAFASVLLAGQFRETLGPQRKNILDQRRSFFGVYRVSRDSVSQVVMLQHGPTLHGAQSVNASRRLEPLTYYHRAGPAGDVFTLTRAGRLNHRRVAIVGLGAGSLACYGRPGERWTFYEIDPAVATIALDPRLFTFLRDCAPSIRIVLGDARLTLPESTTEKYDVLVLDAFSSDAIPMHLLTQEALAGYVTLLAPNGVIALHISNLYLDLEPVVAALAEQLNLVGRVRSDLEISSRERATGRSATIWAVLSRSAADFGDLENDRRWRAIRKRENVHAWTDDFSNIIRVFKWRGG
jgi:spermidine synthase